MSYIIYGTSVCKHCSEAKRFLEANGIPYEYREVGSEEDKDNLSNKLGFPAKSVPQIFKVSNDVHEYVGGLKDLKQLH